MPGVETMAPAALFFLFLIVRLFLIVPNTLTGHFEGRRRNAQIMDTSSWHYSGPPSPGFPGGRFEPWGLIAGGFGNTIHRHLPPVGQFVYTKV